MLGKLSSLSFGIPKAKLKNYRRGPEIENWYGVDDGVDPAGDNDWSFLPFMALSDGAHAYVSVYWATIPR